MDGRMDQSKFNNNTDMAQQQKKTAPLGGSPTIIIPKRAFTTEFFVGLFATITLLAGGWLAVGLGGINLFSTNYYVIRAEFDNVSGLKDGASVEIAGVQIGEVISLELADPQAIVVMHVRKEIAIHEDDIAAIRTKGIIGDRYVKISRGSSDTIIEPGGTMLETEAVVDFEDIIGKLIHSFSSEES
jgi:phospholipid/cholesterol/gamma-HCH transport system substrate-binding protein